MNTRRLFLASNSKSHGMTFMQHLIEALLLFLGEKKNLVFVPFALQDWKSYTDTVRKALEPHGITVTGINEGRLTYHDMVRTADAVFVGGGNTFRLLAAMQQGGLIRAITDAVDKGMPYIGSSAGTNVACPTIKTTNDMPIVFPSSFDALNLVPFQINPHYVDPDPKSTHMGETRDERIAQFFEEKDNAGTVIGLREGAWLTVENGVTRLHGKNGAKIFKRGAMPTEWDGPMSF